MKFIKNKKYSILSNILKYSFVFVIAFALVAPFIVTAEDAVVGPGKTSNSVVAPGKGSPKPGNAITGINFKIDNPIKVGTIPAFIELLLNIILKIGIPIVALAIIYCGFLFVKAMGNSEEIKKAKSAFVYTIIGAFLLLGAWLIAQAIQSTVNDIISTS